MTKWRSFCLGLNVLNCAPELPEYALQFLGPRLDVVGGNGSVSTSELQGVSGVYPDPSHQHSPGQPCTGSTLLGQQGGLDRIIQR